MRTIAALAAGAFLVVLAGFVGSELRAARVPVAEHEAPSQAAGPGARPSHDPFDGIPLPRLEQFSYAVNPTALTEHPGGAPGSKRVVSEEGGWSLEVPSEWTTLVRRLRGGELYSYDPRGMDYSGNVPPAGGVRMSVEVWPDVERRGPAWYADNEGHYAGAVRDRRTISANGISLERALFVPGMPPPFDKPVAYWFGAHPSFEDRVLRIELSGAEGATLEAAERIVSTLRLSEPVSGPREPIIARSEIIARRTSSPTGKPISTPTRIEAKLILVKDQWLAGAPGRTFTLDPDTPIWVVMEYGTFAPAPRACRFGCDGVTWPWQFSMYDARTGTGFSFGGGPSAEPPAWWNALRDRAPDAPGGT